MPVVKRDSKYQAAFMADGRRIRKSFDTSPEAEQFEKDYLAKMQLGIAQDVRPTGETPQTLSQLFAWVQDNVWKKQKSVESTERNCKIVEEHLGAAMPLRLLNTSVIDKMIKKMLDEGYNNATVNRKTAVLSKSLKIATRRGWIDRCPETRYLKESRGRIRFLTRGEEGDALKYFEWAEEPEMRDLFILLIDTGMRRGEALALKFKDVDLDRKLISIWINKTDHPRSIPMTARVEAVLRSRHAAPDGRVFTFTSNQVNHKWAAMRKHLQLEHDPQFIPHTLRHTCASRLVQAGVDLYVVKEWLGHKSIVTTQRYAHLAPKQLFSAARLLEQGASAGYSVPSSPVVSRVA